MRDAHEVPSEPIRVTHITIFGEMECRRDDGCPYCADDHRHIVGIMQFALSELSIADEQLAEELATRWEDQRDG